jgi:hypothetical protein
MNLTNLMNLDLCGVVANWQEERKNDGIFTQIAHITLQEFIRKDRQRELLYYVNLIRAC